VRSEARPGTEVSKVSEVSEARRGFRGEVRSPRRGEVSLKYLVVSTEREES
jgi:hypothetical protein